MMRRTPLRRVGRKAARESTELRAFRTAVKDRAGGWCEILSPACPIGVHAGHHAHHICPSDRDRGVHDPDRGLFLCAPAHGWVHEHPAESYRLGWLERDTIR